MVIPFERKNFPSDIEPEVGMTLNMHSEDGNTLPVVIAEVNADTILLDANMGANMVKNLVTNFIMVLFFCWIISGYTVNNFGKTFLASIFTGLIVFLHGAYTTHIWYVTFDLGAHFADYIISWSITGIWLGWWLNRTKV
jgi:hypothetical protein